MHAVGLGEVLALRGLIAAMADTGDAPSFLVTSTARSSAQVFAANCPPRTLHQFLPLDVPRYLARFLDHWRPALSVWAEQDIWPGAVVAAHLRGIPLALVNARMDAASFKDRSRIKSLYADLYARFRLLEAQDVTTAAHLTALGAASVRVGLRLKAAAPALDADEGALATLRSALHGRRIWLMASAHPADSAAALAAQTALFARDSRWLLALVPRDPAMAPDVGILRSAGGLPGPGDPVWLCDTFGEMGLWLRLAERVVVGGSFGGVGGHNPWEAAALGHGVLHGPDVANFAGDYARLAQAGAARGVTADGLAAEIAAPPPDGDAAFGCVEEARAGIGPLARELLALAGG